MNINPSPTLQETEEEARLPDSFYKASNILRPKLDKDTIRKKELQINNPGEYWY